MDDMVTRLIQELSDEELNTIDQNYILNTITYKEKQSFSSNYWRFSVNVPVLVSLPVAGKVNTTPTGIVS